MSNEVRNFQRNISLEDRLVDHIKRYKENTMVYSIDGLANYIRMQDDDEINSYLNKIPLRLIFALSS